MSPGTGSVITSGSIHTQELIYGYPTLRDKEWRFTQGRFTHRKLGGNFLIPFFAELDSFGNAGEIFGRIISVFGVDEFYANEVLFMEDLAVLEIREYFGGICKCHFIS